jgi:hypothetical protein
VIDWVSDPANIEVKQPIEASQNTVQHDRKSFPLWHVQTNLLNEPIKHQEARGHQRDRRAEEET